jgi:hypothetical protein
MGIRRMNTISCAFAVVMAVLAYRAAAHDIPADARINAFLKPEGKTLELLIRAPLAAMQDIDVPRRGPGYLDLSRAEPALRHAAQIWLLDNVEVFENEGRLPAPRLTHIRVSLASDSSFHAYRQARAHVDEPPLAENLELYWNQQWLDVRLEYPISSENSDFAIHPRFDRLAHRVSTVLRFMPPGGPERLFELKGDPGLVRLDPRWHQASWRFLVSGFWHIVEGTDHLLFLLCLVVPIRRMGSMVVVVTAFTVAHSISLIASALGFVPDALWFPPLVETLIAVTIVLMALQNIVGGGMHGRWVIAFAFGIVHGFGFSFALRESLQFAGEHLIASLVAFNLGVEIGQLAVLVVLVPALRLLFRYLVPERMGIIILSALVAHTGWHWMLERGGELLKFPLPVINAAFLASLTRGLMAALVLAWVVTVVNLVLRRVMRNMESSPAGRLEAFPDLSRKNPHD